ncbi:hypothetical protein KBC75_00420 [Candidatus Shapirobacteria bacterium]|nr:hypothetical protein [Candidatus Shapirobacteria bacterium]
MFDLSFLQKLTSISPRYGIDESKGAQVIIDELKSSNINFVEEPFESSVPRITKAELLVDGEAVPCLGCSFSSGQIVSKEFIHSSPHADNISVVSFYDQPSLAISRIDQEIINNAKVINGNITVVKEDFFTKNILVGNIINPQNIIFAHHDSIIGPGAMDNGCAVAMLVDIIKSDPNSLTKNLFIFAGNEEISYDEYPEDIVDYDGHGFRVFESKHQDILESAKQIFVVDGIGLSSPNLTKTDLKLVLQFRNLEKYSSKTYWLQNDQSLVMKNYHSTNDVIENIDVKFINEAKNLLVSKL